MNIASDWTVTDLAAHFGPIAHGRIRQKPPPGSATAQDVITIHQKEKRLYELIDGVLVEKIMGIQESYLAFFIGSLIREFAIQHDLGFILGADGMARLAPNLVRIPDVSFISWTKVPAKKIPKIAMLNVGPDLAVEVLSPGNTPKEMERKLEDYFDAKVILVWFVDPRNRTLEAFTAVDQSAVYSANESVPGGPVIPGFVLDLPSLFAQLDS